MTPFKKAAFFTDFHHGRSGNLDQANVDNIQFLEWFVGEAKAFGADTCFFLGDFFDNRHSIAVRTMNFALHSLDLLDGNFAQTFMLAGNHDCAFRERRDIHSIAVARKHPHITVVDDPLTIGTGEDAVALLPWLLGDEHANLRKIQARYVLAHAELPGFMMNGKTEMPDHGVGAKASDFVHQEYVFSGHFHLRQTKGKVHYIGNVFPFNFSDAWDENRGAMFLEWGGKPVYKSWPGQPLFRTMKLSELLDRPEQLLCRKATARVTIDIDISYEEAQVIRDTFVNDYGLRKIEMVHQTKQEADQEFKGDVTFQTIDQIVEEGLQSVQSVGLKPDKLVEIWRAL